MEPTGLGGGLFSNVDSGMLGAEIPLHQNQNPTNSQNPHNLPHIQRVGYNPQSQPPQSLKYSYTPSKSKHQPNLALSDEDEHGFTADENNSSGDPKRSKISPWQRMKWTDAMVRLLIMAVFYIGDEGGSEAIDPTGKKKSSGILQKKGKWKSVSHAMMEKGFYVSPQQCEDKFNDLNKRYKRVNDILGKGTACRVVENQNLLDSMDLTPKMKEEVRKLLNSKHLFFREMCAYHSSCGHNNGGGGGGGTSGTNHSPEIMSNPSHLQNQNTQQDQCFHSSEHPPMMGRSEMEGYSKVVKVGSGEDNDSDEGADDDSEEDNDEEDDDEDGGSRGNELEDEENEERSSRKRARKVGVSTPTQLLQQLSCEVMSVIQDGTKSSWEKKQWMKNKLLQLEEQQVNYQCQAFELEKQRMKWVKYSSKKERDMERAKLENGRRRLENERMVLILRRKELELLEWQQQHQQQHSSNKRGDPSSTLVEQEL